MIAQDKIKHFFACSVVAFAAACIEAICGGHYLASSLAGLLAGAAIGVGKEYGDHCSPGNCWDWFDILADLAGSIVGAAVGALFALINH